MVIEDVTGEPFAAFMEREVTGPLGLTSLRWAWSPELTANAPTPYGLQGEPLEYRQLASQAIGSEVSTVADFARFVAAAVEGPDGQPAGRGVLSSEAVRELTSPQPATNGSAGLGYGIGSSGGDRLVMHFGSNPGWNAHFVLDLRRREGFAIANNAMSGGPLNLAVHFLWLETVLHESVHAAPSPASRASLLSNVAAGLALGLGLPWLIASAWWLRQVLLGRRQWSPQRGWAPWLWLLALSGLLMAWDYWFYLPWPLPLPVGFTDVWRVPAVDLVSLALIAWWFYSLAVALFPRLAKTHAPHSLAWPAGSAQPHASPP
jgi:hypothetical protein